MKTTKHLITVWGDVEPALHGPFEDDAARVQAANEWRRENGYDHGNFKLDIDEQGTPYIEPFTGADGLEDGDEDLFVATDDIKAPLKPGDRVKYSVKWLRSVGILTGPIPTARGEITVIAECGELHLADIRWDNDPLKTLPERVNVANLVRENDPETEAY